MNFLLTYGMDWTNERPGLMAACALALCILALSVAS